MIRFGFVCVFLMQGLALGCGSSSSSNSGTGGSGSTSDAFVGTWQCNGSETTTFSAPPNLSPQTESTAASVVITDNGGGSLTLVRTPETDAGTPPCTESAKLAADGKSFDLVAGQTCQTANGGTITYKTVTATLTSPTTYTSNGSWQLDGKTKTGATLTGTGTGTSTCTKK